MKKVFAIVFALSLGSLVMLSCKKKTTTTTTPAATTTPTPAPLNASSTPQVSYSLNGSTHSYVANGSTIESSVNTSKNLNSSGGPSTCIYSSDLDDGNSVEYLQVNKGTMSFNGSQPDSTSYKTFFAVGTKTYSKAAANGIEITMSDASGTWSTSTGTQPGTSTFSIDAIQEVWVLGYQDIRFKASFTCTLYDINGANPRVLTNGVYVGAFENN
jgi:hypothetical protein